MSHIFRLPWFFMAPTLAARGALAAFVNLEPSAKNKIKEAIKGIEFPHRRKNVADKARQLHEELKVLDLDTLTLIVDTLLELVNIPSDGLPEVLGETFKETALPTAELETLIKEISSGPQYTKQRAIAQFKSLALPSFDDIEYFCASRTRFDKNFRYNEDKIETYEPRVADIHPVLVLKIGLERSSKHVVFQLDQEQLDRLISELIAAQKQLKTVVGELAAPSERKNERTR